MNKCLAVLALSSMIAACAAQPAATVEAEKPAAKQQAGTRVCEEFDKESTGTRLGTERTCKIVPAKEKTPQTN